MPNEVGKITTKVYTKVILPQLMQELKDQGLTLCQDADSAHNSKATRLKRTIYPSLHSWSLSRLLYFRVTGPSIKEAIPFKTVCYRNG